MTALPQRLLATVIARLYAAWFASLRLRVLRPDGRLVNADDYRFDRELFALCERDALVLAGFAARRGFDVLVAHGRDGDRASLALEALGCRIVRGSSRRGGARALLALVRALDASTTPCAIVVDGPLGPAGRAKPGAAFLAAHTGRPVRALGVATRLPIVLGRTWSGLFLALPFSRVVVAYDDVSAGLPDDAMAIDRAAADLTRRLATLRDLAERALAAERPREVTCA